MIIVMRISSDFECYKLGLKTLTIDATKGNSMIDELVSLRRWKFSPRIRSQKSKWLRVELQFPLWDVSGKDELKRSPRDGDIMIHLCWIQRACVRFYNDLICMGQQNNKTAPLSSRRLWLTSGGAAVSSTKPRALFLFSDWYRIGGDSRHIDDGGGGG